MGSGDWLKKIIHRNKAKHEKRKDKGSTSKKLGGSKLKLASQGSTDVSRSPVIGTPVEDIAAIRIQTAFRAYMARRMLRCVRGITRLQRVIKGRSARYQASSTLSYLHSWSRIQAQLRARRLSMVTESWINRKKQENQLKLEAKLRDLQADWWGGSETKEVVLGRIHQREEASIKRERAMAYAFTHQWRANSNQNQVPGNYELGRANWGWSWMEHWIAVRPWEGRVSTLYPSPKKGLPKQGKGVVEKNMNGTKVSMSVKPASITPRMSATARKLSYLGAQKTAAQKGKIKTREV